MATLLVLLLDNIEMGEANCIRIKIKLYIYVYMYISNNRATLTIIRNLFGMIGVYVHFTINNIFYTSQIA